MTSYPFRTVAELESLGEASLQTGPFGTQLKASEYVDEGIPVINVRNIGFGDVRKEDLEYLNDAKAEKLHQHRLRKGDIVFGRKGAVERHALIDETVNGWIQGSDCLRLRIKSLDVCERYLSSYLKTQAHQDWMQALCSFGATMSSLNQDIVRRISFPSPPIEVQRRIAAALTVYDELIENNLRRIALLENMAEEIYREWFIRLRFPGYKEVKFVKGVPEGWRVMPFTKICVFQKGKTPDQISSEKDEGLLPYVSVEFLEGENTGYVQKKRSSIVCENGDVLMLMDGARSGFVFRGKKGIVGSTFARIEVKLLYRDIVYEFLRATREHIVSNNTGSAIPHANKEFIHRLVMFLPENETLIEKFNAICGRFLEQTLHLVSQNELLRRSRDALLPRLISGKLSVENLDIQFPPSMAAEMKTEAAHA